MEDTPVRSNIQAVTVEDEMRVSYMDYAMSVIVGRALPDVRDGLKPVHRRSLFAMRELGNAHDKPYKKSARVVGDVIGKYHPHGDTAVYDTIVRMAQDFSLRYLLVDGQGNFGSIDGDAPAAMRYTEVRMTRLAGELLDDIDKDTVDWAPNYDDSLREPVVLPARFPNLLVNGSGGIAVGMATNIPPHNLGEIVDACIALIRKPAIKDEALLRMVPGPDFPTGAFIYGLEGIRSAYLTGRGSIQMRARARIEKAEKKGKTAIVVTELPYQVNKARLTERIAELVRDRKIEGISDLRDESDREGMRLVIELRRDEVPEVILNQLYSLTQMQSTFGVQMLAIHRGRPVLCDLRTALRHFIDFRVEVVIRRTRFELTRAEERAHILEGYRIALDNLDAVIALIRKSADTPTARAGLMARFGLSEIQANAILELRLARLTAMERDKILKELSEVKAEIKRLRAILADEGKLLDVIVGELLAVKERYADPRRTEIVADTGEIRVEDLIANEEVLVTVSHAGYIKRNALDLYRSQARGGKGLSGMDIREDDFVEQAFVAATHNTVLFFTDRGRAFSLKVHELPDLGRTARGKAIVNLINVGKGEAVTAFLPIKEFVEGHYILMATAGGTVKKTDLTAFAHVRSSGLIALGLEEGDRLIAAALTDGTRELVIAAHSGQSVRFAESDVRPQGRTAAGVIGIRLGRNDRVVGMEVVNEKPYLLTVTERGFGKRSRIEDYPLQGRGGKGVRAVKTGERVGRLAGILLVGDDEEIIAITDEGRLIRVPGSEISVIGRDSQGVKLIDIVREGKEKVAAIARLAVEKT
jgi:DNA gyrase subunit A